MKFKFIKYTKVWFTISMIAILIGVFGMVQNKMNTGSFLEMGIDFTGGSMMEFDFESETTPAIIQESIDAGYSLGLEKPVNAVAQITETGDGTYIVHAKDLTEEQLTNISAELTTDIGTFEMLRFTTIGPKVGETLKQKAFTALLITLIAIVLYIAYAFRKVPKRVSPWKFGISAIVALTHDILITLGIFALLGFEINIFFITALLTIMGFSVHDTIVVFDRIRENLKKQGRDDTFADVADASLNQTLTRSINTSISTLFPLVALYIWGSESIQTFVFALLIGILVGTYSSIFIASPILTIWQRKR